MEMHSGNRKNLLFSSAGIQGIIEELPLSKLKASPRSIREGIDGIEQLAESIKQNGLLQPIVVRPKADYFEIIAGHRRCCACKLLKLRKVSCYIVALDDRSAFEASLVENIQRRTMNPLEEAEAFKKYVDEFGWGSVTDLAKKIGKSASYVSKRISLLDLPEDVLARIRTNDIAPSVAEELLHINNSYQQSELALLISRHHLSIKKARQLINNDDIGYDNVANPPVAESRIIEYEKAFDRMILSLRVALSRVASITEDLQDDWIVHEVILHHKNTLHMEIDALLRDKKRLSRRQSKLLD
jgi:ParB family chromosome partitioning protein